MASKSKTQYAILGMLSFKPMSGYEIKKNITGDLAHFWNESYGQIYKTLTDLVKRRLIRKKHVSQIGKPDKDTYSITNSGLNVLKAYLKNPPDKLVVRDETLLKFVLGFNCSDEDTVELLYQEMANIKKNMELEKKRIEESGLNKERDKRKVGYVRLIIQLQRDMRRVRMNWCKRAIKQLGKGI